MFLPDWPTQKRGRTMIVSAGLHIAMVTGLVIGPMWAISEPVDPVLRFNGYLPPLPVQLEQPRVSPPPRGEPMKTASAAAPRRAPQRPPDVPPTRIEPLPTSPDDLEPWEPLGEPGVEESTGTASSAAGVPDGTEKPAGGTGIINLNEQYIPNLTPPIPVSTPDPIYPESARRARIQGVVILQSVIGTDGHVQDVRVVTGANPLLDRAAVDAVRRWIYTAAHIDRRAVSVYLTVTLTFSLKF